MAHYDPFLELGISCDASEVGICAELFHHYLDDGEKPIANVSETLTDTQHRYSQIHKDQGSCCGFCTQEVRSIPLWKALHFGHGPQTPIGTIRTQQGDTPFNCQSLGKMGFDVEAVWLLSGISKTCEHDNADALSCLAAGSDIQCDGEKICEDVDNVCRVQMISVVGS